MGASDIESDGLAKLLEDVQRTIRDNELFIRHLKEETVVTELPAPEMDAEVEADSEDGSAAEEYEEL